MTGPTTKGARTGWAVVTGASSGLGREFALALAARGHPFWRSRVAASACTPSPTRVGARGGRLEPLVADLSTTAGVEALLARAAPLELELLVNNAGVATYGPFAASRAERERELVRVNVEAIVARARCGAHQRVVLPIQPGSGALDSPTRHTNGAAAPGRGNRTRTARAPPFSAQERRRGNQRCGARTRAGVS